MPRKTKAERERIKVTCLWCENVARTHLICSTCIKGVGRTNAARYLRLEALDERRIGRNCQCGAPLSYETALNAKWCEACRTTNDNRRYAAKVGRPLRKWTRRQGRDDLCSQCGNKRRPGKRRCADCQKSANRAKAARKKPRMLIDFVCACGKREPTFAKNKQRCESCQRVHRGGLPTAIETNGVAP